MWGISPFIVLSCGTCNNQRKVGVCFSRAKKICGERRGKGNEFKFGLNVSSFVRFQECSHFPKNKHFFARRRKHFSVTSFSVPAGNLKRRETEFPTHGRRQKIFENEAVERCVFVVWESKERRKMISHRSKKKEDRQKRISQSRNLLKARARFFFSPRCLYLTAGDL